MIVHGGEAVKMLKINLIKKNRNLYIPVGKYQFTMACIRALVMIVYQVIDCLISQPNHVLWVLIRARGNEAVLLSTK